VKVEPVGSGKQGDAEKEQVNLRIPLGLIRAGIKLGSILPESAKAKVNAKFGDQGIDFDLDHLKGPDIEEVITHLSNLNIDVAGGRESVKIYCE
jgi:hypothetical protein